MKRAKPSDRVQSGFTYDEITLRISIALKHRKRGTQARLCEALRIDPATFSHSMNATRSERFDIEQLGLIAAFLEAPTGWPFIEWDKAEAFEKFQKLVNDVKAEKK